MHKPFAEMIVKHHKQKKNKFEDLVKPFLITTLKLTLFSLQVAPSSVFPIWLQKEVLYLFSENSPLEKCMMGCFEPK